MMKRSILILCVFLFWAGCSVETPETSTTIYITKVISDPPGARIELDDDYIGVTPLEIQWEVLKSNRTLTSDHEIRALPTAPGQYVQTKSFIYFSWNAPVAPKTIFFDMHLGPVFPPYPTITIDDDPFE
jgi:hypothetical protein